jgi:hypothetical protein
MVANLGNPTLVGQHVVNAKHGDCKIAGSKICKGAQGSALAKHTSVFALKRQEH